MYREFPPIAFLAALSLLLPLPWHWRAGNVATLSIIAWLFTVNIIYGIDAIVWANNVNIVIPVWCDITTKIIIGSTFALPAACLCICIHLEKVASVRQAKTTRSDKFRRQIFEAVMCFGLPVIFMALHYIVQGHRYDIIEDYGCRPATYVAIPSIFLIWVPPLILATLCLIFAVLAFLHFMRRRITFVQHLDSAKSGLSTSRYFRLMLMAIVEMVWNIVCTSYSLWFSTFGIRPWTSWSDVHWNFSRVDQYPAAGTPQVVATTYYALWWMVPASSFIFVVFFAFGKDAVDEYWKCIVWFRRCVFKQPVGEGLFSSLRSSYPATKSNDGTTVSIPRLPGYQYPSPPSPAKSKTGIGSEFSYLPSIQESDSSTEPSTPLSPPGQPLQVPSLPFTPSSTHTARSPRPFTYPSFDASHRDMGSHDFV